VSYDPDPNPNPNPNPNQHLLVKGGVERELEVSEAVGRPEEDHLARGAHKGLE
jgi:hypothetical protein